MPVSASVTPDLTVIWLKDVLRPWLNRQVTVVDFSAVTNPSRSSVIEVQGRRLPVGITDVRGSRRFEITLRAADRAEADAIELFASFGSTVYVQVPAGCVVPSSLYAVVGDVVANRPGKHDSQVRYIVLPLTEVDSPDPALAGSSVTCAGVVSHWATCGDLLADTDVPTCLDLLAFVSDPIDEVVG